LSIGVEATLSRSALLHNLGVVRSHCSSQKIWAMVKANGYGHGLEWVTQVLSDVDTLGVACLDEALRVREIEPNKPVTVMRGFLSAEELQVMQEQGIGSVLHCWEQVELLRSASPLRPAVLDQVEHKLNCPRDLSERMVDGDPAHKARDVGEDGARDVGEDGARDVGEDGARDVGEDGARDVGDLPTWIKIDTGMHRLGFQPEDVPKLQAILPTLPVEVEGWMTHLAKADDKSSDMTQQQLSCFQQCGISEGGVKSIANSAAILAHPSAHADWVRPGLMLYGVSPFAERSALDLGLKPVMTVKAPVLSVKMVQAGSGVGYGQTWVATEDTPVATIGIGYGDGYPREVEGATVSINGIACPVIGRVSMDMLAADLRPLQGEHPAVGSMACIWGKGSPVEQLALASNTIPYTLLTRLASRVRFKEED
jgi:alanine racemase